MVSLSSLSQPSVASPLTTCYKGAILSAERITPYVAAILDFSTAKGDHLQCPSLNETRYRSLKDSPPEGPSLAYFFALDLRNCRALLPRLLSSIVEAARFLGPDRCALSIVEGNSPDGTGDILAALSPELHALGMAYHYQQSDINPSKGSRIPKLAALRNLALAPLVDMNSTLASKASPETTVLFVNDVAACAEDLLELALQRRHLGADMTCAMDWTYVGPDPTFYDVWVARGITGDSFFEIPSDGSWDRAWHLFWNDATSKARLAAARPFQVFACWNGATAFTAKPLLGPKGLRFRDVHPDECGQGEPQMFCKDLWHRGYRKIAVVPSVSLEYSDEGGKKIKALKGFTSDVVRRQTPEDDAIDWAGPPDKVKCMQGWQNQFWRPWNETLKGDAG
jgi:alpha-1,3-mannosyltransferase